MSSRTAIIYALLLLASAALPAANAADESIHVHLLPPEFLVEHRTKIGLNDGQLQEIRDRLKQVGAQVQRHQADLKRATAELAEILANAKVDESAAMRQFEKVLAIENQVKQLQVREMIRLRNGLSARQQQIASDIQRQRIDQKLLERRLQAKAARIEREVQTLSQAGRRPNEVVNKLKQFPDLVRQGNIKEAEALLDSALKTLKLDSNATKPAVQQNGR